MKDVGIGEVVVATKVYGHETGKDMASGLKSRPDLARSAHSVEQAARALRLTGDWRKRLDGDLPHHSRWAVGLTDASVRQKGEPRQIRDGRPIPLGRAT